MVTRRLADRAVIKDIEAVSVKESKKVVYKVLSDYDLKPSLAFSLRTEGKGLLSNKLCAISSISCKSLAVMQGLFRRSWASIGLLGHLNLVQFVLVCLLPSHVLHC